MQLQKVLVVEVPPAEGALYHLVLVWRVASGALRGAGGERAAGIWLRRGKKRRRLRR